MHRETKSEKDRTGAPPAKAATPKPKGQSGTAPEQQFLGFRHAAGNFATAPLVAAQGGKGASHLEKARPEKTPFDLTGRYESANGQYSLHVNQAGYLVLGHWRHHGPAMGVTPSVTIHAFEATVVSTDAARMSLDYSRTSEAATIKGTMTASRRGDGTVVLRLEERLPGDRNVLLGAKVVELLQLSAEPLIAPRALTGDDDVTAAKASEQQAGPTAADEQRIAELAAKLEDRVSYYVSAAEGIPRAAEATKLDAIARDAMKRVGTQHGIIVRRLREHLSDRGYEQANALVPVWDWLQIIVTTHPQHTRDLQRLLRIEGPGRHEGAGTVKHKYRYKTMLVGAEVQPLIGIGAHKGVMIIEKLSPGYWSQTFSASQFTVSGGKSIGLNFGGESSWSEFEAPLPWEPRNFVGSYELVEGVKGIVGPIEATPPGTAIMTFHGDGLFRPLAVDGSGYATVIGAGLGASAAATKGRLSLEEDPKPIERRLTDPPRPVDETRRYQAEHSSYFDVNSPLLTEDGRAALRTFVARHRAALTHEWSKVLIEGFASPTGTEARNQQLSYLRAANVHQYLEELLGDEFRARVGVLAHGDKPAREAGVPVTEEAQAWRAVHIKINGLVVLRL